MNITFPHLPNIKNFKSRKEWEGVAWLDFIAWCAAQNPRTLQNAFESVVTPRERTLIVKRAAAISRIHMDIPYREIGAELWLTRQTISAIKKGLISQNYTSHWEKSKSQKRARQLAQWKKVSERSLPKRYRRTKYGKVRIL